MSRKKKCFPFFCHQQWGLHWFIFLFMRNNISVTFSCFIISFQFSLLTLTSASRIKKKISLRKKIFSNCKWNFLLFSGNRKNKFPPNELIKVDWIKIFALKFFSVRGIQSHSISDLVNIYEFSRKYLCLKMHEKYR